MKFARWLSVLAAFSLMACSQPAVVESNTVQMHREPPRTSVRVAVNRLKKGLPSLARRKVGALVVFNLPDGYLLRAKTKINPPDFALKEVLSLQTERTSWLNEALVVNCDSCDVKTEAPLEILPERLILRLIDRVSLRQAPTSADWKDIEKSWPDRDVIWLILGAEDYEQKRGPAREKGLLAAWSQSTVTLRSLLRDRRTGRILHDAFVVGNDQDLVFYERVKEPKSGIMVKARIAPYEAKDIEKMEPSGSAFDSPRYDDVYPYPPVPESPLIVQKALLRLTEALAP